eukprot:TRINITY_DN1130_c0_g6_i1.p1 TRINITY_DN1130_c0_g6~~TRINITY_DN1130_c0_g6_i1.p1  ORF type:complete len:339 (-),score=114.86 TRINITY_DN1130_c0_g6_i1:98-1114(-)
MAERKATNKYYPPEWDPSKGSINTFRGQHPLRERARKLKSEGILVVRFEMPFNVWCGGCKAHIGKGVRYNAEKKQVGKYHSTKIWQFKMKCHLCPNYIFIETDPANSDYVVTEGGQKKMEEWDAEDTGVINLEGMSEEQQKMAEDPFYRLEHEQKDQKKAEEAAPVLDQLIELRDTRRDDYKLSQSLRKSFRDRKNNDKAEREKLEKKGIYIPLLAEAEEDQEKAGEAFKEKREKLASTGGPILANAAQTRWKKKIEIKSSSIFGSNNASREARLKVMEKLQEKQRAELRRALLQSTRKNLQEKLKEKSNQGTKTSLTTVKLLPQSSSSSSSSSISSS